MNWAGCTYRKCFHIEFMFILMADKINVLSKYLSIYYLISVSAPKDK